MKVTRKLTLLVMAFAMIGCNEQVSPKLQDANSSTVVPPTVTPSEYYLKVTNTSLTFKTTSYTEVVLETLIHHVKSEKAYLSQMTFIDLEMLIVISLVTLRQRNYLFHMVASVSNSKAALMLVNTLDILRFLSTIEFQDLLPLL